MKTEQEYQTLYTEDNQIIDNGTTFGTLEDVQQRFPDPNWVILPMDELPENWHDMTIVNRQLVPASKAVIAKRKALKLIADKERTRATKQARFANETDSLLFDAIEEFAKANPDFFTTWLTAKAQIRDDVRKEEGGEL